MKVLLFILTHSDPTKNKLPIHNSTLALHFTLLQQSPDCLTLDIRLCFIGRTQQLLTEACLHPNQVSISDPNNSPELLTNISTMLQSLLLSQSSTTSTSTATSPSTPITHNTTPTLDKLHLPSTHCGIACNVDWFVYASSNA
jgi:hypothetical protein